MESEKSAMLASESGGGAFWYIQTGEVSILGDTDLLRMLSIGLSHSPSRHSFDPT